MRTRWRGKGREGKGSETKRRARSGMPRMLSHRLPSRASSYRSLFPPGPSLLVRPTHSHPPPPLLYLSLRTYSVFPSPRPIYLPPCVAEWILFVSHRYFSEPACRSPSKTVSPPRFMFPPTQRRIDPFLLSDVYVCGGASFTLPSPNPSPPLSAFPRSSRSRRPPRPRVPLASPSSETSFQRFCHPPPAARSFLPLTAFYRLVTSVSRARDLRASAPGRTIEHYDFSVPGSFYIDGRDGQIIYKSIFTRGVLLSHSREE